MPDLPPVPDCEGPQLYPYQPNGTANIVFLEEIGKGLRGCVFKVQIDGKLFALKVFYYQLTDETWVTMKEEYFSKVDAKLVEAQCLPFHTECRAYARLKETAKEQLAVRCHGYLLLTEAQKKGIEQQFGIETWWDDSWNLDTSDPETQQAFQQKERSPLCALVKDFIHSDIFFGPEHAPMMIKDLHQLHRLGIINNDIKEDAYVDGKLVDFSEAIVVPHIKLSVRLRVDLDAIAQGMVHEELANLRATFLEWNEEHGEGPKIECDVFGGLVSVGRLRRGPLSWDEYPVRCFNPRKIKWRKFSAHAHGSAKTQRASGRKKMDGMGKKPTGVPKRKTTSKNKKLSR